MIDNATVRLIGPAIARQATDPRAHDVSTQETPTQRASLRQMSTAKEVLVVGRLGVSVWVCRLQTTLQVLPGWTIEARLDGEREWHRYTVRQTKRSLHMQLIAERVQ